MTETHPIPPARRPEGGLWPYLAVVVLVLLFFSPRFVPNSAFLMGDTIDQNIPNRVYATRALQAGRLPHWVNEVGGGFPFLSDPQPAVFYPPHLVLAMLTREPGEPNIADIYLILHYLALGCGGVFLARSFGIGPLGATVAGFVTAINGFTVNHLGHANLIHGLTVLVWGMGCMSHAVQRRSYKWSAGCGLLVGMALLAGHVQPALHALYAMAIGVAAYMVAMLLRGAEPRKLFHVAGIGLFAVALAAAAAAIQIGPTLKLLSVSWRDAMTPEEAMQYSLPLRQLPGLFFPGLYHVLWPRLPVSEWGVLNPYGWGRDGQWEYLMWGGVGLAGMALFGALASARRMPAWLLFAGAVFVLVASLGARGGIYPFMFEYLPMFKSVRIPPRMMWLAIVIAGLLAGFGLDALMRGGARNAGAGRLTGVAVFTALLASASLLLGARATEGSWSLTFEMLFLHVDPAHPLRRSVEDFTGDIMLQVLAGAGFTAVLLAILIAASRRTWRPMPLVAWAGALLIVGEVGFYGFHKNICQGDYPEANPVSAVQRAFPDKPRGRVVVGYYGPWQKNTGMVTGVETADIYNPATIRWTGGMRPPPLFTGGTLYEARMNDMWNVTDWVFRINPTAATLGGMSVTIHDFGILRLSPHPWAGLPTAGYTLPYEADRVHLLMAMEDDSTTPGTRLGEVVIEGSTADAGSTVAAEIISHHNIGPMNPADGDTPVTAPGLRRHEEGRPRADCSYYAVTLEGPGIRRFIIKPSGPSALVLAAVVGEFGGTAAVHYPPEFTGWGPVESQHPHYAVFRRSFEPAWAAMVPEARALPDDDHLQKVREHIADPGVAFGRMVFLRESKINPEELARLNAPAAADFEGTASVRMPVPEHIVVATSASANGWLFVPRTYYSGWSATVDGVPAEVHRANGAFMAVAVPGGQREVVLRYFTPRLLKCAAISIPAWILALAILLWPPRRRAKFY